MKPSMSEQTVVKKQVIKSNYCMDLCPVIVEGMVAPSCSSVSWRRRLCVIPSTEQEHGFTVVPRSVTLYQKTCLHTHTHTHTHIHTHTHQRRKMAARYRGDAAGGQRASGRGDEGGTKGRERVH